MQFTNIFFKNNFSDKNIIVNIGGARSSKSFSILQLMFLLTIKYKNKKILITRKTRPALKLSSYFDFKKIIEEAGYSGYFIENKTDLSFFIAGKKNYIFFRSLDDPEKIKSTEFNFIFMEEANEFTYEDYQQLKLRLSAKTNDVPNKMFLALNPVQCWVQDRLLNDNEVEIIKSTYKDNPFLSQDYIKMLEDLKNQDENLYRIYALGEFSQLPNIIYHDWDIVSEEKYNNINVETIYGLDFGFNNPTALVEVKFYDNEIYCKELIYQTGLTNQDLISRLKNYISGKRYLFADCAEPSRIKEIYDAGYNIHESDKSVKDGIDYLKRFKIHITSESVNMIKEIKSYSWKTDKSGKLLDEPVKFNDHLMDALRYAVYTYGLKVGDITPPKLKEKKPLDFFEREKEIQRRLARLNNTGKYKSFQIIK